MKKGRILTGHRPTGRRHLGHLLGTLENWARLQDEYECFFLVADWHVLTSDYAHTDRLEENIYQMLCDWLAAGINPERSTMLLQSAVPEHAELSLLFSMLVTVSRLQRNPTYKEQKKELHLGERASLGLLAYPVLQAADILVYRANAVPVGEDQLPHLELSREIARRFNSLYTSVFPEPQAVLSPTPRLPGTDGRMMHTSYGNTIPLSATSEEIREKVMGTITDPQKIYLRDPGHPEICTVFAYHRALGQTDIAMLENDCRAGRIGCVACKKELAERLVQRLQPFREIRERVSREQVMSLLHEGSKRARLEAQESLRLVRQAMHMAYSHR
ncbi:MAG: tryptophan--tRNA ligase [Chloroflexi bacterium]|nr:tryptophan--tRNA ligase [Chloroflexota bacterium]MCL5076099.1 tryptophan--tRNA ligase [Chloroflexota bacterium]